MKDIIFKQGHVGGVCQEDAWGWKGTSIQQADYTQATGPEEKAW